MTSARLFSAVLTLLTCAAVAQEPSIGSSTFSKNMSCVMPDYPGAAIRANAQGAVYMTITVGEGSNVTNVAVTQSSGDSREHQLLDRVARDAFMGCLWLGREPVPPGLYRLKYVFKLRDATAAEVEAIRRGQ